jgi:hypothetical protein
VERSAPARPFAGQSEGFLEASRRKLLTAGEACIGSRPALWSISSGQSKECFPTGATPLRKERAPRSRSACGLHLNELDEQRDYQSVIREELVANGGRPVAARGTICDRRGTTPFGSRACRLAEPQAPRRCIKVEYW